MYLLAVVSSVILHKLKNSRTDHINTSLTISNQPSVTRSVLINRVGPVNTLKNKNFSGLICILSYRFFYVPEYEVSAEQ